MSNLLFYCSEGFLSTPSDIVPGSVLLTGANGSVGLHAAEYMLVTFPEYTAIFTVRDASYSDTHTNQLRAVIARFPNARASIQQLDLSSLASVHAFADSLVATIASGNSPPLSAIICNARYRNLLTGPELTPDDGFDKTFQVNHLSHAALVLRLVGSFGPSGGRILVSGDAHDYPGRDPVEVYPPTLGTDLDLLARPPPLSDGDGVRGRGYQRYANSRLALTTWCYALNRLLTKQPSLSSITALAVDPDIFPDLTRKTPSSPLHWAQLLVSESLLRLPILRLFYPAPRTVSDAARDYVEMALSPRYVGESGFWRLSETGGSTPESLEEGKQEALWRRTAEWAGIGRGNTVVEVDAGGVKLSEGEGG